MFLFLLTAGNQLIAQIDSMYLSYIARYSAMAVNEMHYSKIPASVTMAQALLESQAGTSELAVKANNHFGIKCQTGWDGKRYTYQDDDENTCFRHYDSVEESFRDHSHFLMYRPRYADLFKLDPCDYTAWAHGLKKAGYATNPRYAPQLIKIIEEYNLCLLDSMPLKIERVQASRTGKIPQRKRVVSGPEPRILQRNRIDYCIVGPGEDIASLTGKYEKLNWEIRKYNEIPKGTEVRPGQVIYLQPKRKHAEAGFTTHIVAPGETMYGISQLYGMKLKWLYKRNGMKPGTEPAPGEELWLRGMKVSRR